MRDLKVLVSGVSIAGPALAYWLNRYGCTVTVAENWVPPSRADSFHPQVHFRVTPPTPAGPSVLAAEPTATTQRRCYCRRDVAACA